MLPGCPGAAYLMFIPFTHGLPWNTSRMACYRINAPAMRPGRGRRPGVQGRKTFVGSLGEAVAYLAALLPAAVRLITTSVPAVAEPSRRWRHGRAGARFRRGRRGR